MLLRPRPSVFFCASRAASYLPKKKNYYEVLGVAPTATAAEIKRAFVKKSNELHPDSARGRRGGAGAEDSRLGWRRESPTEKFMLVKEAYDCLRRADRRRVYDDEMVSSSGFLMEAKGKQFRRDSIVDLNRQRNEAYVGAGKAAARGHGSHFRDPEGEYEAERRKNWKLYFIGGVFLLAIAANIGYVSFLQRRKRKEMNTS